MPTLYASEYTEDEIRAVDDTIQRELDLKGKSKKELGELLAAPKAEIARLQEVTASEVRDFTGEEKGQWLRVNREHDLIEKIFNIRATADRTMTPVVVEDERPKPGQGDVSSRGGHSTALKRNGDGFSLPDPRRRRESRDRDPVTSETRALALQGWLLHIAELPLQRRHREALHRVGVRSTAQKFPIPLNLRPPDREQRALSVGTTTAGGYTVPQGFRDVLERAMLKYGNVRNVATVMRTDTGADLPMPTVNDTGNKGALLAENTQVANQDVAFGQTTLKSYKMSSKQVLVSIELIQDSAFNLDGLLGDLLGERIGRIENDYYTTGTGSSQPQGLVTAATVGVTAAAAGAIAADEIFSLIHSLDPAYRDNAAGFMMHDNILLAIRKMKDGQGRYLWEPSLTAGIPSRLLGYPVYVNQSMASTIATTNKTILFGDYSKFIIRDVAELRLRRLDERYADFDQVGFLAFHRTDSRLLNAGTNPVVVLAQP